MERVIFPQLETIYYDKVLKTNNFEAIYQYPAIYSKRYLLNEEVIYNNNIFNLLFNNDFTHTSYSYNFDYFSDITPELRYIISGTDYKCVVCTTGVTMNIFKIQSIDITLLNILLYYRINKTDDFILPNISACITTLSLLIYYYLYFIKNSIKHPMYTDVVCNETNDVLCIMFEDYLNKEIYKYIKVI